MPGMSMLGASAASPATTTAGRGAVVLLRSLVVGLACVVVLLAAAILPLLTPAWIHAALAASSGRAAGASLAESQALSDATVHELLFGPGTFAMSYQGRPLYGPDEIGHLQDVRLILLGLLALAAVGAVILALALGQRAGRVDAWRAVARAGLGLLIALALAGVFAALAFGLAFELFHRLLFPGGNWSFDPARSNLVSLYPLAFWQLSAAAYGLLAGGLALATWLIGRRQARRHAPQAARQR